MVRYYGLCANTHRGKVRRAGRKPFVLRLVEQEEKHLPSKGWAAMIRKVYEVDPMVCPKCGGDLLPEEGRDGCDQGRGSEDN